MELTKPTIHLNGTSREDLFQKYEEAGQALYKALNALDKAAPHARDYYVQPGEAFEKASAEHRDRVKRVKSVLEELMELAQHVAE